MFGLNPQILLGAAPFYVLSIGGVGITSYIKGDHHGVAMTDAKWIGVTAERDKRDHQAMLDDTQRWIDNEMANRKKITDLENSHNDRENYIDGMRVALGRIASTGLFDRGGRPTGKLACPASGTAAGTAVDPAPAPAGCELSKDLSGLLRSESERADKAASTAIAGHDYAVVVKKWLDDHPIKLKASP